MQPLLALQLYTAALVAVAVLCVVVLVLVVVAPSRRVRDEPPLDPEVEARLLLHQDPDEPTGESPVVAAIGNPDDDAEHGEHMGIDDLAALAELDGGPDPDEV
jgi:hypothetical protein